MVNSALITGANGGLGKETARQLAIAGSKKIYLGCRNPAKAEAAKEALEQSTGKSVFEILIIDVSNLTFCDVRCIMRGMARPAEYQLDKVLEGAIREFWMKGYEGASVANLLKATGLTSRSLYNIFGSKDGLFERCLERYYEAGIEKALQRMKDEPGRVAIKNFFTAITSTKPLNGCLLSNTWSDKNSVDEASSKFVSAYLKRLERLFADKLRYASEHEDYSGDPALRAKQLVIYVLGISQLSKSGLSVSRMQELAADFLEANGI